MRTLLLADDSVTIQRVIELTFAAEEIRVVSVGDGRRALQWLERESPDIVLADVGAPEVDGYALATFIRQSARLRRVPVLLLAGAFEPVNDEQARAAGCDGVLVKPFEPEELVARVRRLIAQAAEAPEGTAEPASRGRRAHDDHGAEPSPIVARFPSTRSTPAQALPAAAEAPFDAADRPTWEGAAAALAPDRREPTLPSRVALANAFSALLAAEQATAAPPAPVLTDAVVEDAVRKALTRMTENIVRRIVVETAERLIREEIEKLKSGSE